MHSQRLLASLLRSRDYISSSLYAPTTGYFSSKIPPILPPSRSEIPSLANRDAYNTAVAARYAASAHGWATPVELFSPGFSRALGRSVLSRASDGPVRVVEVGGGRGTLAKDVLGMVRGEREVSWTILEISEGLAAMQRQVLQDEIIAGEARVVRADAVEWLEDSLEGEVHVVACEVLDNFAHDLVRVGRDGVRQGLVRDGREWEWRDGVEDDVREAMEGFGLLEDRGWWMEMNSRLERAVMGGDEDVWVPVVAWKLLRRLGALPLKSLTLCDFDHLPGASVGRNAPIVQRVNGAGSACVYSELLEAPFGEVDIMFPTDFYALEQAFWRAAGPKSFGRSEILKQSRFFAKFGDASDVQKTTCMDGYNPVLNEFSNASVLTVDLDLSQ